MKIGARSAHFAMAAGMIRSTMIVTRINPISSQIAADVRALELVGELDREDLGDVGVVEVGDELGDQQEQEEQAAEPGDRTW